jgi:hypothetical protein
MLPPTPRLCGPQEELKKQQSLVDDMLKRSGDGHPIAGAGSELVQQYQDLLVQYQKGQVQFSPMASFLPFCSLFFLSSFLSCYLSCFL